MFQSMKTIFIALSILVISSTAILAQTNPTPPAGPTIISSKLVDFPLNAEWFNSSGRVNSNQLKNRFVLLNFWTFSSFICVAQLKQLEKLQSQFPELAIIIVHNGKFNGEKEATYIKDALLQHNISFITVNDKDFELWQAYGIDSWPTNLLFSPEGDVIHRSSGSFLSNEIDELVKVYDGALNKQPIEARFEGAMAEQNILSFPSFIESDGDLFVFISDSRNHRIMVRDGEGNMDRVIGTGLIGMEDGNARTCSMRWPRGMALDAQGGLLYIADTGNDLIRVYDLEKDMLTTLLGNGERGFEIPEIVSGVNQAINQPSDLELVGDILYIAMTGWNQIWALNLKLGVANPVAGSGEFGFSEGDALECQLSEPIALTVDEEGVIYFTERQSSAIKSLHKNKVSVIFGEGVFEFGDSEGAKKETQLQGPCGITYHNGLLYVADEYNHKIKTIDPFRKKMTTLIGNGKPGFVNGKTKVAQLNHPADVMVVKNQLYIADAYNHAFRTYDFDREIVSTLGIGNLDRIPLIPFNTTLILETDTLSIPQGSSRIELTFTFGNDFEFYQGAPHSVIIPVGGKAEVLYTTLQKNNTTFIIENDGNLTNIMADFRLFYRSKKIKEDVYFKDFTLMIPVRTSIPASETVRATYDLPLF
jgi:DNA-binding beta-propeller fold protein YncE